MEIILDKSQRAQKYSSATFFYNQGIPVKIDAQHAIAHNKVMVIDGETVIIGSFNFTKAAEENNAENLLVVRDKKLAERYTENWKEHERHLEVYVGRRRRMDLQGPWTCAGVETIFTPVTILLAVLPKSGL